MPLIDLASLKPLFAPQSVAVIGASADPGKIGGAPVNFMKTSGFKGRLIPVNPNAKEIQGLPAFPTIADVDGPIDLAVFAVPAALVLPALEACAKKGVRSVAMFSAGFAEVSDEGRRQQERMTAIARDAKMRLLGPNCMGVVNFANRMVATFHAGFAQIEQGGRIGMVSQSGAFGGLSHMIARDRGLSFTYCMTTGNEADVEASDCLAFLAQDPATRVVLLYLEGVRNGPKFIEALELARANNKPVVAIKLGATDVGAKAAASHTASLAGADAAYDALFRQYGVYRARNFEEFFDIGYACAIGDVPHGRSVGLVTVSGGVGVLMADEAVSRGLDVTPLPEAAQAKVKALVPIAGTGNPIDVTGQVVADIGLFEKALQIVIADGGYDSLVSFIGSAGRNQDRMDRLHRLWADLRRQYPRKLLVTSGLNTPASRAHLQTFGVLSFEEPTYAVRAIAALAWFGEALASPIEKPAPSPRLPIPSMPMNEVETMVLLRRAGLPMVDERLAKNAAEAERAAAELGFPVVLKVVSADILHKSDVGGVALDLKDAAAVREAFKRIMTTVRSHEPKARIDGCLVAPMVGDGVETILGVNRDPVLGPVVMFGLGGIFVEALKDVTFRVAPFGLKEAHRMIRDIRAYPILEGLRGRPPADVDALAETLSRLSAFTAAHADDIESLDLNPVMVRPKGKGVVALDAVLVPRTRR
ncbi:MAG TPA: acetate--CoA ligase family protein [Candidatus Cybelea sp.]|nr:acetate--CoA ligase family protein [Candidatus Cybelea sp.]